MFIGYAEGSKAYRILDPETACAHGARRCVRRRARMGVGQGGGRWLGSDVRQLHRRVRPLRGSWGSRQLLFAERAYPSPRAFTDSGSTTLSSRDSGCDEFLACTTTAGDTTHSSTDSHSSGHVYSDTCSC